MRLFGRMGDDGPADGGRGPLSPRMLPARVVDAEPGREENLDGGWDESPLRPLPVPEADLGVNIPALRPLGGRGRVCFCVKPSKVSLSAEVLCEKASLAGLRVSSTEKGAIDGF